MPASPAMRFSPGRESRADNHKRGRSLENGVVFKERDDDLALFNEVQTREQDNFLLQSNDDFEDTFGNFFSFSSCVYSKQRTFIWELDICYLLRLIHSSFFVYLHFCSDQVTRFF